MLKMHTHVLYFLMICILRAGGGKGVIAAPEYDISHPGIRKQLFLDYGDFLSSLNGCYGMISIFYLR